MDGIELTVGQARTVDARMQIGSLTDVVVEVKASAELLNQNSAEVGGVIESTQINEIPLSGRNWATLMTLAPGAINYGGGSQRDIRFNGHSLDDNNFTFDGIDTTGIQEQTQKAEPRLTISLDSIQEFRVSSAVYTAESGAAAGVQVNVVSKSGSNDFHGATYEYLRNQIFDTRSPFDDSNIPPFRLNQFLARSLAEWPPKTRSLGSRPTPASNSSRTPSAADPRQFVNDSRMIPKMAFRFSSSTFTHASTPF
jgi:hypothetical protein